MPRITVDGKSHWVPMHRYLTRPFRRPWHYFYLFANRPPNQTAAFTGITAALLLVAFSFPANIPLHAGPPPAGWVTFRSAYDVVSPTVKATPGGPWQMTLAEGVASASTWSPSLSMWTANATQLQTVLACQSYLAGPSIFTFWPSSEYPTGSGPAALATGSAGLWTFVYLNATGHALVVSVLHGSAVLNGVVSTTGACGRLGGPFSAPTSYLNPKNVTDTSSFADSAFGWLRGDEEAVPGTTTAYFILGNPVVPINYVAHGYNQEWSTYYSTCGAPGVWGATTYSSSPQPIPTRPGYVEQLTFGRYCYQSMIGLTPGAAKLSYSGSTYYAQYPLVVNSMTSQRGNGSTAPGLSSGLFGLEILLNSTRGPFSVDYWTTSPECSIGTSSLSGCAVSTYGWYAALLAPNGTVVNTYPSYGGADNWTSSNTPVESGDSLAIVASAPVFSLYNSGIAYVSSLDPYVCCGIGFGPDTQAPGGPYQL